MNRIQIASKLGSDDALHWDFPVGQAEAAQEMQGVLPASLQFLGLPEGHKVSSTSVVTLATQP